MSASSRTSVFCGVDLGSTNIKVVLLTREGTVVRRTSQPTPRGSDLSVDADEILDCGERLIVAACGDRYSVRAIAVAGVGEDGVLVDEMLDPVTRAMTWFDPRRAEIFNSIRPRLAVVPGAGAPLDAARSLVGWHWAARQPAATAARYWIALTDYLAVRWTGVPFMGDTIAARTAAWDINHGVWQASLVDATLGTAKRLPPVYAAGRVVGPIRSTRLARTDLLTDDAVAVVGGHDHPVGGWGVSQLDSAAVLDSMGTAEVVVAQSPNADDARPAGIDMAAGIKHAGRTLLAVSEIGRNVAWAGQDADVAYWIKQISAGNQEPNAYSESAHFVPGEAGGGSPRYDDERALDAVSKASAVLGALARSGQSSIDRLADYIPGSIGIYAAGGWARSAGWMALKERYSAAPIRIIPEMEVTAVGAALLAADAIGEMPDPEACLMYPASCQD